MFQRLLVPHDLSPGADRALQLAVRLAQETRGSILLLHIGVAPVVTLGLEAMGAGPTMVGLNDKIAEEQRLALERVGHAAIPADVQWRAVVREGFPPEVIIMEAAEHDLIVMGTHGRTGIERVVLGSVTERVIRGAPIPVLVTR